MHCSGQQEFGVSKAGQWAARVLAVLVPLAYVVLYTPYGMDTTDFGFFYGYPWRIVQGEMPYRDFFYINPAFPLFWHAFWLKITPESLGIIGGKLGYVAAMLGASWLGTLFLNRVFALERMGLPLPLLATGGFVWGVHTFAHVPWHTVDGILFASGALYAGVTGFPLLAGLLCGMAFLSKQSFLLLPPALFCMIFVLRPRRREVLWALAAFALVWLAFWGFLRSTGAWEPFRVLTSKPLDIREALEAGIYIYLRQEWWIPLLAALPWLGWTLWQRGLPCVASGNARPQLSKDKKAEKIPAFLQPVPLYIALLAVRYMHEVGLSQQWIGFGESWPTLGVVLGGVAVLLPCALLRPWLRDSLAPRPLLRAATAMAVLVLVAWSAGISGGYKTPAMYAIPLLFAFFLVQARLGGKPATAAWTALLLGLIMFRVGYEYPYTFPNRSMPRASLTYHAGDIFPKATALYVDRQMYETLQELKELRGKYGPNYRVLPGFPHAYFLTNDKPAFPSEWLLDWQIVFQFEYIYQLLIDKDITVFMLRDQLYTEQADGYARAAYTVPQMVRKRWRVVEKTEHYVVLRPPLKPATPALD